MSEEQNSRSADRRRFLTVSSAAAAAVSGAGPAIGSAGGADRPVPPVRIGQIGTRHAHAAGKMATLRKFPELFEVVGVAEDDARRRDRLQNTDPWKGLTWMSSEELLAVPGLQAVMVETDIDELLSTAERCIDRGLHIHLDKPAGTSLEDFQRVCRKADERGRCIQMGYMFRSNPAFRFVFDAVRRGWLGDIFHVHGEMSKKVGRTQRQKLARYAGGSMFELGCHLIDAVVAVLGRPQNVQGHLRGTQPESDDLMDTCLAVLEYPRAIATVRSSVCEVDGWRRRQFVVCGTRGTVVIQPLEPFRVQLTLETDAGGYRRGTHAISLPPSTGRYDGDLQHFAHVICGQGAAEYDTAHDLAVQEAVLQASGMSSGRS